MTDSLALLAPHLSLPIGEHWRVMSDSSPVCFPYDGTEIGRSPLATEADARDAVDAAAAVFRTVSRLTTATRRAILHDLAERVREAAPRLEEILISETGKPRRDCRTEVQRTLVTLQATAEEASRIHGETVPLDLQELGRGMVGYYTRKPAGIVLGIAGFNYPLLLASHKLAPAIAAGCPVIIKPAPNTPLATLELIAMAREVLTAHGVPAAAVQLVNGDPRTGETMVRDPRVTVVSFTGSAAVGHLIAQQAAPRKTLLELGSNTGFIVAADADVEAAVAAVLAGGFYANGQACISVQRIIVQREVAERFTTRLAARMSELVVGDPRDPETHVAPVIHSASAERIQGMIDRAVQAGAQQLTQPSEHPAHSTLPGLICPTVLANVNTACDAWNEEIFGPVVCITTVDTVAEAIDLVNASRYGLQAAVFTASLDTAFTAIDELEVGGVVVNEIPGFRSDIMPYGGVKDSGIGREGPRYAIEEYTVTRMAMIRPATPHTKDEQ